MIGLCRNYNTRLNEKDPAWKGPLVYNTYQMYLTSSLRRLKADVHRAQQKVSHGKEKKLTCYIGLFFWYQTSKGGLYD